MKIEQRTEQGYLEAVHGDGLSLSRPEDKNRRGRVQKGRSPTLQCNAGVGVLIGEKMNERIRVLTPREYWRLMGFSDEAFDKASKVSSKTQLYIQAGNSIVVPVLEAIFRDIYLKKQPKMPSLERWGE